MQIGFGDIKEKKVNKPMQGHFAKAGVAPMRYLREVRVEDASEHAVGDTLTVEAFNDVDKVDVIGASESNTYDLLDNGSLVMTKDAVEYVQEVLS